MWLSIHFKAPATSILYLRRGATHEDRSVLCVPSRIQLPKAAATCVPDKVPQDKGVMSQTSGHSPVTTEESERSGLQFGSF